MLQDGGGGRGFPAPAGRLALEESSAAVMAALARPRNDRGRRSVLQGEPEVNGSHAMRGLITGKDVVRNAFTIIRLWGWPTYLRCVRATLSRRPTTFLSVVYAP